MSGFGYQWWSFQKLGLLSLDGFQVELWASHMVANDQAGMLAATRPLALLISGDTTIER